MRIERGAVLWGRAHLSAKPTAPAEGCHGGECAEHLPSDFPWSHIRPRVRGIVVMKIGSSPHRLPARPMFVFIITGALFEMRLSGVRFSAFIVPFRGLMLRRRGFSGHRVFVCFVRVWLMHRRPPSPSRCHYRFSSPRPLPPVVPMMTTFPNSSIYHFLCLSGARRPSICIVMQN